MDFTKNILSLFLIFFSWKNTSGQVSTKTNPNILFFLTDDWGFNDVGYYENTDTATPFIDSLVSTESLRIDKFYVLPECTVTRCALLTGRHPMRYGMQDGILQFQSAYALSRHETLLSNEFQDQGYKTWLVGKWHVGMRNWDYTPNYRGFDEFLGYYGGLINYYDHYGQNKVYKTAVDFRWNENEYEESSIYTLHTYTERVLSLLDEFSIEEKEKLDKNEDNAPFFMYVGWQGSHSPSEAPDEYADLYSDATDSSSTSTDYRQYFQAQTTMTDDLFKEIVTKLKATNLWENTLIIFASDNGGSMDYGDNSPLRGGKFTIWEGGVRVPAFITGGILPQENRGKVLNQFPIHVTDWYPTLLDATGLSITSTNKLDGKNMWPMILNSNNIIANDKDGTLSLSRTNIPVSRNAYGFEKEMLHELNDDRYILVNVNSASCDGEVCGALIYGGRWKMLMSSNQIVQNHMPPSAFWMRNFAKNSDSGDILGCNDIPDDVVSADDPPCNTTVCLFDLLNDPCEYYDVSESYPDLTEKLYNKLMEYSDEQIPPLNEKYDYADYDDIDPTDTGFWHPWDDASWTDVEFEQFLSQYYTVVYDNNNNRVIQIIENDNDENDNNDEENDDNDDDDEASVNKMLIKGKDLFGGSGSTKNNDGRILVRDGQFFGLIVGVFLMIFVYCAYLSGKCQSDANRKGYLAVGRHSIDNDGYRSIEEIPLSGPYNYQSIH